MDLLGMGFVLSDIPQKVGWRVIAQWVKRAPRTSNLYQLRFGAPARWGDLEYMTALIVDYLALTVWMQSKDGQANRRRPDSIIRPGAEPKKTRFGNAHMSLAAAKEWLGW